MGSMESTLPAMEPESSNAPIRAENNENPNLNRRSRHETEPDVAADDPWWWEVENENLILDQVPLRLAVDSGAAIATVVTHRTSVENHHDRIEVFADDFNTLPKIGENVNLILGNNSNNESMEETKITATTTAAASSESETLPTKSDYSLKSEYSLTKTVSPENEATTSAAGGAAAREQSLEDFKEELRVKRLARQTAVQDLRAEITTLREELHAEKQLTQRLRVGEPVIGDITVTFARPVTPTKTDVTCACSMSSFSSTPVALVAGADADDADPISRGRHANIELADAQLALQLANADNLSLRTELGVVQKQVGSLKEVIACCKQMLTVKEEQCDQLKGKLQEIETSFGEREMKIMSDNLRQEYERQLGNIRQLRQLYEERQRISAAEHENLQRLISIKKDELLAEQEKTKQLEERNQTLLKEVEVANNELAALREECNEHKFEKKALKEEMGAVNTLFSQMVMGFNGKNNLDIDRLTTMLEENRTLLNDMATKEANCSDGATLPKLLFELVEQAAVGNRLGSRSPTPTSELIETETTAIIDEEDNSQVAAAGSDGSDVVDDVAAAATVELQQTKQEILPDIAAICDDAEEDTSENITDGTSSTIGITNSVVAKPAKKNHQRKTSSNKASSSTSTARAAMATLLPAHETGVIGKVSSAQEIIGNLPKVWKVLMELLSHHKIEQVQFEENGASEDCYKSVETPSGPKAELSVSKTYIKLKDLIMEKKSLVKETNRLKTLNCHLDYRLNEQEKRLSAVSLELTKTWHLVGKMQRQHRQLHTQEQILRYQLQQKRRLLTELKDELEYCRRKWAAARAKNDESQEQCNDLRREFARRKLEDANNSAESGYSDSGGPTSSADEEERIAAAVVAETAAVVAATADGAVDGGSGAAAVSSGGVNCRRKHLKEMFEHARKIKRMQSTSPGRAGYIVGDDDEGGGVVVVGKEADEIVLRWNSAPPTCGWRGSGDEDDDNDDDDEALDVDDENVEAELAANAMHRTANKGAVPKSGITHKSRGKQRAARNSVAVAGSREEVIAALQGNVVIAEQREERANRIQRLEEQCKSLIQQVLETSDNRERLEVQLCEFQDEIAPVQYAVPLDEFINKKRIERMTRASSLPLTLTAREEEYTRKRSERLGRLEEESRQLMSRIKRTSDRGHYLRCSLDRIRRAPSREGSFESNTEEEVSKVEEIAAVTVKEVTAETTNMKSTTDAKAEEEPCTSSITTDNKSPLTANEEAYTARRAARLQRLEEESKQLLNTISRNTERGGTLVDKLDDLHERYSVNESEAQNTEQLRSTETQVSQPLATPTIEQRIENIEKISSNREERLRILEEEGKQLLTRLSNTSDRGTQMINRIAEREVSRQARSNAAQNEQDALTNAVATNDAPNAATTENNISMAAAALPPTPKTIACTSIVGEELRELATVTTTPSRIAAQQGAIPKSKPIAQLSAVARAKNTMSSSSSLSSASRSNVTSSGGGAETLEDMVKRLQELPFPAAQAVELQAQQLEKSDDVAAPEASLYKE